ncbi:MAG: hypothetical protein Pg6A_11990 [Termitinemataceae bacterium]|nr:MAG: hypothetical protein Pg6A_11990 [Termitinemataceae bacterium]
MLFFGDIRSFFIYLFNPHERAKLKIRVFNAHEVKKNKYSKFYNTKTCEAQIILGHFFYDIYKCVMPYQKTFLKAEKSEILKEIIFNHYLDERGRQLLYNISEEFIKKESAVRNIEDITSLVKTNILIAEKYFNAGWMHRLDTIYNQIICFSWFVNFDYVGILRFFSGSEIIDISSFGKTAFEDIGEFIKDFLTVSAFLDEKIEWPEIFTIIKEFDASFPDDAGWSKLYTSLNKVLKSGILTLIVRHAESNSDWLPETIAGGRGFTEEYISGLGTAANKAVQEIDREVIDSKTSELLTRVFPEVLSLNANFANYYNSKISENYENAGYGKFVYAKQFNYLYLFFHTFSVPLREVINIVLIKGKWSSREVSSELSQLIHDLNDRFQEISAFDHSMRESGERGIKLHAYYAKASVGKRNADNLRKYIDTINFEAYEIIMEALNTITQIQKHINTLEIERQNRQFLLVRNWSEIDFVLKEYMPLSECAKKTGRLFNSCSLCGKQRF